MDTNPRQKNLQQLVVRLLGLFAGLFLLLLGWLILYKVLLLPIWAYWLGALGAFGFVVWFGYSTGLFRMAYTTARMMVSPEPTPDPSDLMITPVEIAKIAYTLQDPVDCESFDAFLDEPRYHLGSDTETLYSPSDLAEKQVLDIVERFEELYHGQVSVDAVIRRGSLIVGLTFLATSYTLAAQYKDFIESASLARSQLRNTFSTMSDSYRGETGREIQVITDVSVQSRGKIASTLPISDKTESNGQAIGPPVTVTNSISPGVGGQPINVNVSLPSTRRIGCSGWIAIALATVLGAILFILLTEPAMHRPIIDSGIQNTGSLVEGMGQYLQRLGVNIREFQYTGP